MPPTLPVPCRAASPLLLYLSDRLLFLIFSPDILDVFPCSVFICPLRAGCVVLDLPTGHRTTRSFSAVGFSPLPPFRRPAFRLISFPRFYVGDIIGLIP